MLGMMNAPSDSVEFYATNPTRKSSDDGSEKELAEFTQSKNKDIVSYTEDGRKMVNGKISDSSDAPTMWGSTLLRGRMQALSGSTQSKKAKKAEKVRRNSSKKMENTIAVVASLQKMTQAEPIIGQKNENAPKSVEITPPNVVGLTSIDHN